MEVQSANVRGKATFEKMGFYVHFWQSFAYFLSFGLLRYWVNKNSIAVITLLTTTFRSADKPFRLNRFFCDHPAFVVD